ncbi:MAG: sugar phosphate isomerase/epimerase [Eubacteriales bacterium]|nr:sugar phosphate isomerase/epimerase [Eubacteriales bacterium]
MNKRIIASTMVYNKRTLEGALSGLKEAGYEKTEVCIAKGLCAHYEYWDFSDEKREAAALIIEASGLVPSAVNQGIGLRIKDGATDPYTESAQLEGIRFASRIGAKVVSFGAGILPEGMDRKEYLKKVASHYCRMAKTAREEYGITLSVEAPHKKTIAEKPEEIFEFWSYMDDSIMCTLDIAHFIYGGGNLDDAAARLADRVSLVHLRDAVPGDSLKKFGEGIIDFANFFKNMRKSGYKGDYSLEFPSDNDEDAAQRLAHIKDFFAEIEI